MLTGCSGDDVMATIGLPTSETETAHGEASAAPPGPGQAGSQSNALVVTAQQRAYLDALHRGGGETVERPDRPVHRLLRVSGPCCEAD